MVLCPIPVPPNPNPCDSGNYCSAVGSYCAVTNTLPGEMVRCVCLTGYVGNGRNCTGEREGGRRGREGGRGREREGGRGEGREGRREGMKVRGKGRKEGTEGERERMKVRRGKGGRKGGKECSSPVVYTDVCHCTHRHILMCRYTRWLRCSVHKQPQTNDG